MHYPMEERLSEPDVLLGMFQRSVLAADLTLFMIR